MELTEEQIAELGAALATPSRTAADVALKATLFTEYVPTLLAEREGLETNSVLLDRLMDAVTDVLKAQDGYRQTQIIGRIQTVAERSKWEGIRQEALDRLHGVAVGVNYERIKAKGR